MPIIEPDLSEVQSSVIHAGTYQGKIVSVEAKPSKAGNPMLVITWEVDVEGKPYTRKSYPVTSGAGAFNFEQLLRACHFSDVADKLVAGEKIAFDTDNLIDQQCNLVIEETLYNNAPTDQIKSYIAA